MNSSFEPIIIDKLTDLILVKGDNQGSIALVLNLVFHTWTKYINIQYNYIRDKVAAEKINLTYVPIAEIIADGLTKPLTYAKFHEIIKQMGVN